MEYFYRFANLSVLWWLGSALIGLVVARHFIKNRSFYTHSLVSSLLSYGLSKTHFSHIIFFVMRLVTLVALSLLIARPQWVDSQTHTEVEGIDIVLVLDVSGSMDANDAPDDKRSRFAIAKAEALRFIDKRMNDAFGLVIFANVAMSLCPLTMDRLLIREKIEELRLGFIDENGTKLAAGMVTAANRLRRSTAKSKIMILLTDGEPSQGDMNMKVALEVVQELGIKVYTVGIGNPNGQTIMHPFYGPVFMPGVNKELLDHIAQKTGGKSFLAHSARDMRDIYQTIDRLERTRHETVIFGNYHDIYIVPIILLIFWSLLEFFLATFVWFMI